MANPWLGSLSAEMLCTQCGHANPPESRFCSACGARLEAPRPRVDDTGLLPVTTVDASDDAHTVSKGDLPAGHAALVVRRGPNAGSRFVLEGRPVTVGRSPECDIFLDDVTVSRRHARFVPTSSGYTVQDDGSLNGTYLNRDRIEMVELANGDEVQIGKFRFIFLLGDAG